MPGKRPDEPNEPADFPGDHPDAPSDDPGEPTPLRDPPPKVTPMDDEKNVEDGIDVNET